jgi:TRAP-type C4-dicarboxylate transport system substrate-binding protein
VFSYTKGRFPVMEAFDNTFGYESGVHATQIINDFYNKFKPKELDQVKVLFLHAHGPGLLHTRKPVHNLEDLQGMKIRCTGSSAMMVKALGGVPVAMPQGDTYEALQKGVVDGTFSPMEVLKGWKQAEVVKSTTECYSVSYSLGLFVLMNRNVWNRLPPDVQQVINLVSHDYILKHGKAWDESDKGGREATLARGNQIIPLSAEESARWSKAVQSVTAEYVAYADAKGLPGKDYVAEVRRLMEKYRKH